MKPYIKIFKEEKINTTFSNRTYKSIMNNSFSSTQNEIEQLFPWLRQCKFENAEIISNRKRLIWLNGTWNDGIWLNGVWEKGVWQKGVWRNGVWEKGVWVNGTWETGTWVNGKWQNGVWLNGVWENGKWEGGTWRNGTWITGKINGKISLFPPNKI